MKKRRPIVAVLEWLCRYDEGLTRAQLARHLGANITGADLDAALARLEAMVGVETHYPPYEGGRFPKPVYRIVR